MLRIECWEIVRTRPDGDLFLGGKLEQALGVEMATQVVQRTPYYVELLSKVLEGRA